MSNTADKEHFKVGMSGWFIAIPALFLAALWYYTQLLQWKKHGDDFMLTVANIVVTVLLWLCAVIAVVLYRRRAKMALRHYERQAQELKKEIEKRNSDQSQPKITATNDNENLAAYAAALGREITSLKEQLNACNEKRQMPRPYLEVLDTTESMPGKTLFVFTNRGGDVAHKVQVQPLSINHRTVTFDPIETIAVDAEGNTLPTIVGSGVLYEHDILLLLTSEWDAAFRGLRLGGLPGGEWPTKVTITYEDFAGKQFEAMLDLVVFPIQ